MADKTNVVALPYGETDDEEEGVIHIDADTGEVVDKDGEPTGRSIEDLADEGFVPPFVLLSPQTQLSFDPGNDASVEVVGSIMKLKGGPFPIIGQYRHGQRIKGELEVEVIDVTFKGIRSKYTGGITGVDRIHVAEVSSARSAD